MKINIDTILSPDLNKINQNENLKESNKKDWNFEEMLNPNKIEEDNKPYILEIEDIDNKILKNQENVKNLHNAWFEDLKK